MASGRSLDGRAGLVVDTAITVIARQGMRALTHRAVDRAAGLPIGSTSYYFRTRDQLLAAAIRRLAALNYADLDAARWEGLDPPALAEQLVEFLALWTGPGRDRQLARYALSLEAITDPTLRSVLHETGLALRDRLGAALAAAGVPDARRRAGWLVAFADGLLYDQIAGAGSGEPMTGDELRLAGQALLRGILADP